MGDYYHQFLSSMSGAGVPPVTTPDELQSPAFSGAAMSMAGTPMAVPYQNLGYFTGYPDPIVFSANKASKGRRKSGAGLPGSIDHIKHRRTRSGCFMCRTRRVKCDESRPVCDRCRKGNRECVYPDAPTPKLSTGQPSRSRDISGTQQTSPTTSNEDDEDDEEEVEQDTKLDTIHDEVEPDERFEHSSTTRLPRSWSVTSSNVQRLSGRQGSETPSQEGNKSSSPSASTVTTASFPVASYQPSEFPISGDGADWSQLPTDFQYYLNRFVDNMTHFHYCMGTDHDDFFKTILPQVAVRNEPLLNALVGFSAYHATLQNPNGKIRDFLQYYNKSVTLLLSFFKRKEKHNVATLLTILQLATIEEYLGDWVNLMGHQKAAFEIITKIFTPQSVMQTPMGRMCLSWYARFDNFVALMGGFPTDLPREWFNAIVEFHQTQIVANPNELRWKIDERSARLRLITYDMSIVFARGSRGQLSPEEFIQEHDKLSTRLLDWKTTWDTALSDPKYLVTDFAHRQPLDPDDFVDPYAPGVLYSGPLLSTTVISEEWHSIMIMHMCQSSNTPPEVLFAKLMKHAYATCQIFETLEFWPSTPKGALVLMQAGIAIATLFLPQDDRHQMWLRRKFAILESMGYIHPLSIRSKMAELFREPSCVNWWLPDNEGFSPVLQAIRDFADERNAAAVTAQQESLREVRHIFAKLELADQHTEMMGKGETQ